MTERDRQLALLARQAGFTVDEVEASLHIEGEVGSSLERGRADLESKEETEDARFAQQWDRAAEADFNTEIVAHTKVRQAAKGSPEAAKRWLDELAADRALERARELTTY